MICAYDKNYLAAAQKNLARMILSTICITRWRLHGSGFWPVNCLPDSSREIVRCW